MQPTWKQLTRFRRVLLDRQPPQVWMQPLDAPGNYRDKFHAATATETGADLAGRITLAVPLVGCGGTSRAAALAIDADSDRAIQRAHAATRLGYAAFTVACASGSGGHNEEHVCQTLRDNKTPRHCGFVTPSQVHSVEQQRALGAQGGRR